MLKSGNTPTGVGKTRPPCNTSPKIRKHPHGRGEDLFLTTFVKRRGETPPRAWGRPLPRRTTMAGIGNTPTGVGKTTACRSWLAERRKHPHGRGEDLYARNPGDTSSETPPRAWGRRGAQRVPPRTMGNTPTGVGKTAPDSAACRGWLETPPRAWGRQREIIEFFTDNPNRIAAYPFPKPVASQKWLLSAGADRPGRTVCTPEPLECVET